MNFFQNLFECFEFILPVLGYGHVGVAQEFVQFFEVFLEFLNHLQALFLG